jgi:hypothetical protein
MVHFWVRFAARSIRKILPRRRPTYIHPIFGDVPEDRPPPIRAFYKEDL